MIQFFPKPYADELLYSIIARFASVCFEGNPQGLNMALFNYRHLRATIDLPGFTAQLSQRTFHLLGLDAEEIINNLTLLPFYRAIVTKGVANEIENLMKSNYAGNIHAKIGINTSSISRSRFPRYCKQCVNSELESNGEAYWHRAHQLPGMVICPVHFSFLETVHSTDHLTYIAPFENKFNSDIRYTDDEFLKIVSKTLQSHLLNPTFLRDVNYKARLIDAGYARGRYVDTKKITQNFENFFGKKSLELLSQEIGSNQKWVTDIVRKPERFFNPVRHILMDLFTSSLSKISHPKDKHPFGNGPWICINKASDHFLKYVVTTFSYHNDTKTNRLIGVFKCDCGMEYTKSYITRKSGLIENIRIKVWGEVWKETLTQELKTDASLRSIARKLGTDAKTISLYKRSQEKHLDKQNFKKSVDSHKAQWIEYFRKNPHNSISEARQMLNPVYAFLYRNAKLWLIEYNVRHYKSAPTQLKLRLNWPEIDANLYSHLKTAFQILLESNHKGRITRALLAKTIKEDSKLVAKNSSKLPMSNGFLMENCESVDNYQIRRIRSAVSLLRSQRKSLKEWRIVRISGLKHPIKPDQKKLIQNLLK